MIFQVNGKQYTGADARIAMFGREEDEIVKISIGYERSHTHNETLAGLTSYSVGSIKNPTCSIELMHTAVIRIENAARAKGVADITLLKPFPITVNLVDEELDERTYTIFVKFQSAGIKIDNGTDGISQEYEMFVTGLDIQ